MPEKPIIRQTEEALSCLENSQKHILITGGPTCEDIDPVRFLSNRSTGRMGIALAETAKAMGCQPLLVLGPTHLKPSPGISCINVRNAADMLEAVETAFPWCDILVMSAAVADYTPVQILENKLKKNDEGNITLELKRTADILKKISIHPQRPEKLVAGFSLDTIINIDEGKRKLHEKGLDLIAVNGTSAFGTDNSSALFIFRDGKKFSINKKDKHEIAHSLLAHLLQLA